MSSLHDGDAVGIWFALRWGLGSGQARQAPAAALAQTAGRQCATVACTPLISCRRG